VCGSLSSRRFAACHRHGRDILPGIDDRSARLSNGRLYISTSARFDAGPERRIAIVPKQSLAGVLFAIVPQQAIDL
jgi:hypothetical protein